MLKQIFFKIFSHSNSLVSSHFEADVIKQTDFAEAKILREKKTEKAKQFLLNSLKN